MAQGSVPSWKEKLQRLWGDPRPYWQRLLLAAPVMLALCDTFLFFGPLEMVAFSQDSLLYTYGEVLRPLLLGAGGVFLLGTVLLALLRGKLFDWGLCLLFAATVCGYLQAAFFNGSLGTLTGDALNWSAYKGELAVSLAVWGLVTGLVFLLLYLSQKLWRRCLLLLCGLLVVMQLTPTVAILAGAYGGSSQESYQGYTLSSQGMYEFSREKNTLVFVLDRMDYRCIEGVLAQDPAFFDRLDGFTGYTNATSVCARTRPAMAQILTGYEGSVYQKPARDYFDEAWSCRETNLLEALEERGYTAELYTTLGDVFGSLQYARSVDNLQPERGRLRGSAVVGKLWNLSAYRYAPTALKPFFWADTNYYNTDIFAPGAEAYTFDDAKYGAGFPGSTADRTQGCFKFYHFSGPHPPYHLNADGTESLMTTSMEEQTMGSFSLLYGLFDRMKALGIYQDAAILITADHGDAWDDTLPVQRATRIGLFYKPAGSAGTPLAWSRAPVCTDNLAPTLLRSIGASCQGYGLPLEEVAEDADIQRTYYKTAADPDTWHEAQVFQYRITGDAADFSNWEIVDTWDIARGNWFY